MSLKFNRISFSYPESLTTLFVDLTAHFPKGWTGVAGPNGAGKTTVLKLASGELEPQQGTVQRPGNAAFCAQRTDDAPQDLGRLIASDEADAGVLRGRLQIGDDWAGRWDSLSHGERKRAQIAVALFRRPDVLLIDEPTNHIDLTARAMLMEALEAWRGVGLIVSHDRELLDRLCTQCLLIEPPDASLRPGNYTRAFTEARREEQTVASRRRTLRRKLIGLTREANRRQAEAARSDARMSKKRLGRGDKDGRAKLNLAKLSGKDAVAGRLTRQMEGRLGRMQQSVDELKVRKRYKAGFWLEGSPAPRDPLISLDEREFDLDGTRTLTVPDFLVRRDEKVALTGANGLGKSTFLRDMLKRIDIPEERLVYLPQEIDLSKTREILAEVQALSNENLGSLMSVVSGLGSRPDRLLDSLEASPGETRKVLLALGVIRRPWLIVMDEPTNHLDLPAIELLESALKACPCALILVSHDLRFLSNIADRRWHLTQVGDAVTMALDTAFGGKG